MGTIGKKLFSILENILLADGLKTNLISISQACDKVMNAIFWPTKCIIIDCEGNLLFEALKNKNVYIIDIIDLTKLCQYYVHCLSQVRIKEKGCGRPVTANAKYCHML